ncbi:MAG TPA: DUF11 domain-containing protein [Acidobacteriota bacterium]
MATATSDTADGDTGNNTGTATTTVDRQADLSLTKSDSPDPVAPGANLTYTIEVSNAGPSNATSVTMSDPLPAGTTFQSVTPPMGWMCTDPGVGNNGTVSCTIADLAVGGPYTFTIVVQVTASSGVLMNTATVSSADDGNAANDSETEDTTVVSADLMVTKSDDPDPVVAGENITYTVTVTNNGPAAAVNAMLSDAIPSGTTFVSATTPMGWTRTDSVPVGGTGTLTFTNPSLANAEVSVFTIVVNVNASAADGGMITNMATATSDTADANTGNNTGTATTTVDRQADLSVAKSDDPDPVAPGANLTYTIEVSNAGPSNATSVTLTDLVPAGTSFVSMTPPGGWMCPNMTVTCTNPDVAVGGPYTFTMVVQVTASSGTIMNTATVASADDGNAANNSASEDTAVVAADLEVTKSDDPDPVVAGEAITYTVTVTNNGPSTAMSAMLSDPIPSGTTFVSATTPMGWTRTDGVPVGGTGTLTFTNPSFANAEVSMFTIVVSVNASAADGAMITNMATATSDTPDTNTGNNTGSATTTVDRQADLSVTKSDDPDPVAPGANLTYTIEVSNAGPSNATSVTLTDLVPAGTTLVMMTPPMGWMCDMTVSCTNPDVAVGGPFTFTMVVQVTATSGTISNTVTVASADDGNTANDSDSEDTMVQAILVTGRGRTPLSPEPPPPTTPSLIRRFQVDVNAAAAASPTAGPDSNESADPASEEGASAAGRSSAVNASAGQPELTIGTGVQDAVLLRHGILTYTLVVTNIGTAAATGVVVVAPVPAHTVYVDGSCTTPQGSCKPSGATVEWQLGSVPIGAMLSLTFEVQHDSSAPPTGFISNDGYFVDSDLTDAVFGMPVEVELVPVELLDFHAE